MHCLNILSFINPPGKESGANYRARVNLRFILCVSYYLMQTLLMTEMFQKHLHKILMVQLNILVMWLAIGYQIYREGLEAQLTRQDI